MRIAMISARERHLKSFRTELECRGFRVEGFGDSWSFLQTVQPKSWNLVVLDGLHLPFLEQLLEVDASLNTAVVTDLDPVAFHEVTEGMGILCALPIQPSSCDVEPLLEKLRAVGGLDPVLEAAQCRLDAARLNRHPHCIVCWERHPFGLKVDFRVAGEHAVEGTFDCGKFYEGYENVLHGGIVSSLLEGAMASCILAKGLEAYTVDLRVRYRAAVETGVPSNIRGVWVRAAGPLHLLHASLEQSGIVRAVARAKFLEGKPNQPRQPMPGGAGLRPLPNQARERLV